VWRPLMYVRVFMYDIHHHSYISDIVRSELPMYLYITTMNHNIILYKCAFMSGARGMYRYTIRVNYCERALLIILHYYNIPTKNIRRSVKFAYARDDGGDDDYDDSNNNIIRLDILSCAVLYNSRYCIIIITAYIILYRVYNNILCAPAAYERYGARHRVYIIYTCVLSYYAYISRIVRSSARDEEPTI